MGHITKDVSDHSFTVGGTATFAGLLSIRLGLSSAVQTSCADDVPLAEKLPGLAIHTKPSSESTTFKNIYIDSHRQQYVRGRATDIELCDIPHKWLASPIVLLGPVAHELGDSIFAHRFGPSLVGLTPQGMMRDWDSTGLVRHVRWERAERLLDNVDVVVFSEEDLSSPDELDRYLGLVDIVVVTRNMHGATVYERGKRRSFPAFQCNPMDPTGAGDVFAAAFLIELHSSGSLESATRFANCAASFVIEGQGTTNLPTRDAIEERVAAAAYLAPDS